MTLPASLISAWRSTCTCSRCPDSRSRTDLAGTGAGGAPAGRADERCCWWSACCAASNGWSIGTYRPRVEPLWDRFVRRTEFVTGLYEGAAVPALLGMLAGTPFLPPLLRCFGARIGRRTWIGTTYLTEFDLVEIGDDAEVGRDVSLQTHLFEDRVMKMSDGHGRPSRHGR